MTLTAQFTQRLDILRAAAHSPAAADEWNQPTYDADAVVATLDGQIMPLTIREVAALADAGAQIGDYRAFLDAFYVKPDGTQAATDVRSTDRIRVNGTSTTYEVRQALDAAGRGHHWELMLRRVVD